MFDYNQPTVAEKYVLVKCEAGFPAATKKSAKAHKAIVDDMVANGADRDTAEKMANGTATLFPDGQLKDIKSPYYSFINYLDRVSWRWIGGKGAPKLVSVHLLDKIESKFSEAQLVMLPLISQFKAQYNRTLDDLEKRGGHYFERADYPTVEELEQLFRFELNFTPIGDPTQFDVGVVSPSQQEKMKQAMDDNAKAVSKAYAKKLRDDLQKITQQLLGGKIDGKFVRFSESNVANLMESIEANLNASGDPELAAALHDAKLAAEHAATAAIHKDDAAIRTSAANATQAAANKLAGLF